MKKIISLLIISIMLIVSVVGCSENNQQKSAEPTGTVISNSEQQDTESTVTPFTSVSPTPSASPSVSPSPSPTATTSKSNNGVNGKDGRNGRNGQDGADGQNGADGSDGQTPYIGSNGNWWIGNQDTGVSATGQGSGESVGTSLANVPVGTKFPCYPNKEFDWVTDDGITVHISSIDIELTDKETIDFDKWVSNPDYRKEIDNKYSVGWGSGLVLEQGIAYKLNVRITGKADSSLAGRTGRIYLSGLFLPHSEFGGINISIGQDGTFTVTGGAFFTGSDGSWDEGYIVKNCSFQSFSVGAEPTPSPTPTPEPIIPDVNVFIDTAKAQLGKPYVLGGKGGDSFDTSGYIYYVLKQSGSAVGYMTSSGWANSNYPNAEGGFLRGDILCMSGRVAIYLGNNQMIEASQAEGKVAIIEMDDAIRSSIICGKRLYNLTLPPSSGNAQAERFVTKAFEQLDVRYALGGKEPTKGFDDSGLVYYALNNSENGSYEWLTSGGWASSTYQTVDKFEDLQYGDIICLPGHVAICLGDNMVIDASSSADKVVMREMGTWFKEKFICGKRLFGASGIAEQSSIDSEEETTPTSSVPVPSPSQTPTAKETATESPTPSATGTGNTERS